MYVLYLLDNLFIESGGDFGWWRRQEAHLQEVQGQQHGHGGGISLHEMKYGRQGPEETHNTLPTHFRRGGAHNFLEPDKLLQAKNTNPKSIKLSFP